MGSRERIPRFVSLRVPDGAARRFADSTPKRPQSNDGDVGGPPKAEDVVLDFMAAFIAAWPTGDATTLSRFFSENAEYCNGPFDPVHGRQAIVADFARMMSLGGEVEAEIRHLLTDGAIVMTERVDYVRSGGTTAGLKIAGVFEVHDGVITAWRDYFDPTQFGLEPSAQ
jgi:limonene-1,2-epoxide hydrolase